MCGQFQYLSSAASAVVGGDEVAADCQREREHAPCLDVVGVVAECAYERAQVHHAAVVNTSQAPGHRSVAPCPVAYGQVDWQQFPREGEHACHADLLPGVAALS